MAVSPPKPCCHTNKRQMYGSQARVDRLIYLFYKNTFMLISGGHILNRSILLTCACHYLWCLYSRQVFQSKAVKLQPDKSCRLSVLLSKLCWPSGLPLGCWIWRDVPGNRHVAFLKRWRGCVLYSGTYSEIILFMLGLDVRNVGVQVTYW